MLSKCIWTFTYTFIYTSIFYRKYKHILDCRVSPRFESCKHVPALAVWLRLQGKLQISWNNHVFPQNAIARTRTSDLPGEVPSTLTTTLPHLGIKINQNLLILYFIMKTPENGWDMIRFIANALLSPIHIIKILLQSIRGAVTPNIGLCGALVRALLENWPYYSVRTGSNPTHYRFIGSERQKLQ